MRDLLGPITCSISRTMLRSECRCCRTDTGSALTAGGGGVDRAADADSVWRYRRLARPPADRRASRRLTRGGPHVFTVQRRPSRLRPARPARYRCARARPARTRRATDRPDTAVPRAARPCCGPTVGDLFGQPRSETIRKSVLSISSSAAGCIFSRIICGSALLQLSGCCVQYAFASIVTPPTAERKICASAAGCWR